jgi:heparanase 1
MSLTAGETGSAYGGGAPGLSDRYVAGFLWLDKLGMAARLGVDVVVRQSLSGANYGLLDPQMEPLPVSWMVCAAALVSAFCIKEKRDGSLQPYSRFSRQE